MLLKPITYCGQAAVLLCDGRCDRAWGINSRPRRQLSADDDDHEFLADGELDTAPANPGTYEGGDGKPSASPITDPQRMNRWCARECERCSLLRPGEPLVVKLFDKPRRNKPM